MVFALIGNQNCGKTTLFNQLTGSNQHVGNFPGVTVEKKEGVIKKAKDATVVDLPGIYSLSPYTAEEVVTRDFLIQGKPDAVINIVDATNIERNLYLTLQVIELGLPMVGRQHRYKVPGGGAGHPGGAHFCQQERGRQRIGGSLAARGKEPDAAQEDGFLHQ